MSFMSLTYRTSGAWGPGKGSNLTPAEIDQNFYSIAQWVASIEDNPLQPNQIANITASNSQLTVWLSDGTSYGPFTIPRAMVSHRGAWRPLTAVAENEIYSYGYQGLYLVLQDHTTEATFDPDADNTEGPLYQRVYGPVPGSLTQTIATASYSLVALDANTYNRMTNAGGCIVEIPNESTVDFDIDTEIHFRQCTAGGITITAASGVTINGISGFDNSTEVLGAVITIKKVASNTWDVFGLLAQVS